MAKVMLYLDDDTAAALKRLAKQRGLPSSRLVAQLIQAEVRSEWPPEFLKTLGSCPDFPLARALRATEVPDLPRAPL
jgi:hypothetical protein